MANSDESPMWEYLKTTNEVHIYRLPVYPGSYNESWAHKLPHMVKGVTIYPKSLPDLFSFLLNMTFQFRKEIDPLITNFQTLVVANNKAFNELSLCYCRFKPPTLFLAPRDFLFCTKTYLLDSKGEQIQLPSDNEPLDKFVYENKDKIDKIFIISRSVLDEEAEKCAQATKYALISGDVRGFIRCICWSITRIDEHSCRAQTLSDFDIRGYVPDFIKSIIAQHNATGVITLKKYFEKHK